MYSKLLPMLFSEEETNELAKWSDTISDLLFYPKDFYTGNNQLPLDYTINIARDYLKKIGVSIKEVSDFGDLQIYSSTIHGLPHNERVVLLGTIICAMENIPKNEYLLLLEAFKAHDIGRVNDGQDVRHGERSAQMLSKIHFEKRDMDYLYILCSIVKLHSVNDSSLESFKDSSDKNKQLIYKLGRILKDADNLDRVRLSIYTLDPKYLRTESAKRLTGAAIQLIRHYKNCRVKADIKDMDNIRPVRQLFLGGTGEMILCIGTNGGQYIFKPSISKFSREVQPFRAYAQECAYDVQSLVDPLSAVPCKVATIDGRFGAIQQMLITDKRHFDLVEWQDYGGDLPKNIANALLREFVTDYLLCNFDSHSKNFIFSGGKLIGIDKEQCFKHIDSKEAQLPTFTFHPNSDYGEREPIYNTLFKRYINGELNLDFTAAIEAAQRVQETSLSAYSEIFVPYVSALKHGDGEEELLNKIVDRKHDILGKILTFKREIDIIKNERIKRANAGLKNYGGGEKDGGKY